MKIVSLFTKAPGYKRFSYEPRYYDEKAEAMKEREERIRKEIELERGISNIENADYRTRMKGSFQSARKRSQTSKTSLNTALVRLGVLLFLTLFIMAYMTWGKNAFYSLILFAPIYLYLRFKNRETPQQ